MPLRDTLSAVLVMLVWGMNFVVIERGLDGVPPLLFVALRFAVVLLALPFVARPDAPLRRVLAVGACMSLGQFGLLYSALALGMPPGLASLVLQAQAVLTVGLAALVLGERPLRVQLAGVGVGALGLGVVALGRGGSVPVVALVVCVLAALSWATGNVLVRRLGVPGGLGLTVWSALVVPVPALGLSLLVDGPAAVGTALTHLSAVNWLSTAYTAVLASLVGYGIWNRLLERHPASDVAPFTLLVPPIGIATAWVADGEVPTALVVGGGVLLVLGVALVTLGPRWRGRPRRGVTARVAGGARRVTPASPAR
ncbi:EamA family transporter [Phycicoccus jejuensis]|uniref:EamA family transporter n=1 Tax=Phycicoccus jejuensis TaxID=367299 RepID=UPI00068DB078|nr:EamA family transporter [Phycicoccus jejuensis]